MRTDLRLAIPAALSWAGLGVAIGVPDALPALAAISWIAAAVLVSCCVLLRRGRLKSWQLRRGRLRRGRLRSERIRSGLLAVGIPGALALALGGVLLCSAAARAEERAPSAVLEAAASGRSVDIAATTTQLVTSGDDSFTVTIDRMTIGEDVVSSNIPARVFGEAVTGRWGVGSTLTARARVELTDPGDATALLVFVDEPPLFVDRPHGVIAWADGLRGGFAAAAAELPGDGGALLPGLAIGDTVGVGPDLDAAMKTASLSHLMAVSGANCAVVVGLVMIVGQAIGVPRWARITTALAVLGGFVVLVTPQPSVLRAAVMVTIVLVATIRGRPSRGVPVLSGAVLLLLVIDPWLAREYGFILSVVATAGLLLLASPLTVWASRWMPRPIAAAIAIPVAAQLACQPVLILLAPQIPTYGVVANLLAAPAAPIATVVGLAACVLLPVAPPLGTIGTAVAWAPSAWIAAVARFVDSVPGNSIPWWEGPVGVTTIAGLSVLLLACVLAQAGRVRRASAALLALVVVAGVAVSAGTGIRTMIIRPAEWQYAACDVGQGDAMLIRSGAAIALVDTGAEPAPLAACLDELGVTKIDLLVLTHFDLDHVGGVEAVLGRVDAAIVGPTGDPDDTALVTRVVRAGADVTRVARGSTGLLGELRWKVLWPPEPLRGVEPGNDASVALEVEGVGPCAPACLDAVFLGDLGEEAQQRLLATNRLRHVDVIKVAHHGSADQAARLYRAVDATVALIGVGADNTYGHPTDDLLGILAATGTTVTRTDVHGIVLVAPGRDDTIQVWSERGG